MQGIVSQSRVGLLWAAATPAAGANKIGREVNMGGAQNATVIVTLEPATDSDLQNFEIWTSTRSDFATAGTALSALASDGRRQIVIGSDHYAEKMTAGLAGTLNINSTGTVAKMSDNAVYAFDCRDVSKFLNVQYDNDGTGSELHISVIGHDVQTRTPWPGVKAKY